MIFRSSLPNDQRYFPMLFVAGKENAAQELLAVWNTYKTLPQETKNILSSDEITEQLVSLQKKFRLDMEALGEVTILVRELFFGSFSVSELDRKIAELFSQKGIDPAQASTISSFIQKEILTLKPKPKVEEISPEEKKQPAAVVRMPLLQALSQYEQLGNQLITRERIKIKSQAEPVRPSLLYWIKYYRDELGVGHHNTMERGNFLFRSENGRRLSPEERERVNLVLKSVEENTPLDIDTLQSVILFPTFVVPQSTPRPTPPLQNEGMPERSFVKNTQNSEREQKMTPSPSSAGTLSFSSKHVLPAEKERSAHEVPTPSRVATENMPPLAPKRETPMANPFHIRPVSTKEE